jgi:hypothetical protein
MTRGSGGISSRPAELPIGMEMIDPANAPESLDWKVWRIDAADLT